MGYRIWKLYPRMSVEESTWGLIFLVISLQSPLVWEFQEEGRNRKHAQNLRVKSPTECRIRESKMRDWYLRKNKISGRRD